MKITAIDVFQHDLPVKDAPYRMGLQDVWHLDSTIVRLECDDGTVAYGETCPLGSTYQPQHAVGARAALAEMAPYLLGMDPTTIGRINATMDSVLMGHRYAKAAIDVACWDATGKSYGVRICDLLGGAVRERVPSYHGVLIASPEDSAADA
ncbi:MAG: mandelate racemase, partial [Acidimicrobiaceae bacterium]|nr:mandelate racemase [Acidimicrobiaceae bacterium]